MSITITTLIENTPSPTDSRLICEHGLSLYIEVSNTTILFDTGQSGDIIQNAAILGKDLSSVDYMLVSHGHYDHGGGVTKLLEEGVLGKQTQMIVGNEYFRTKYLENREGAFSFDGIRTVQEGIQIDGKSYRFAGVPYKKKDIELKDVSLREVEEDTISLSDDIIIFHHFKQSNDFEQLNTRFVVEEGELHPVDCFKDEISLGIKTDKGIVLIVGCSHIGIVNIISDVVKRIDIPIYMVIGGTHLIEADEERVDKTIEALHKFGIAKIAASHCTGDKGIEKLKDSFKDGFILNTTGNIITI